MINESSVNKLLQGSKHGHFVAHAEGPKGTKGRPNFVFKIRDRTNLCLCVPRVFADPALQGSAMDSNINAMRHFGSIDQSQLAMSAADDRLHGLQRDVMRQFVALMSSATNLCRIAVLRGQILSYCIAGDCPRGQILVV